jgi:hypothetical protein
MLLLANVTSQEVNLSAPRRAQAMQFGCKALPVACHAAAA